tara:strand:+ start:898 stop:2964 length:2067 start_codon:yes stop_codon:yes gene_type:complete
MKKVLFALPILLVVIPLNPIFCSNSQSSEFSGSNSFTVSAGTSSSPKYYITSVATSGDPVFSGTVVDSGGGWDTNSSISFGTDTNSSGSVVYPFASDGVFNPSVQIPDIGVTFDGSVSALSASYYGGYKNTGIGFAGGAPEIIIEGPSDGADGAAATATVSSGEITGFTVTEGGSGYGNSTPPKVTIVGGPHFVKIVDEDSNYTGRVFLINDNNRHCVTLDTSRLADGESTNLSTYFPVGTACEVVPAPTLGSTFGISTYSSSTASNEIPQNWTAAVPESADWIYLWDTDNKGYEPYFFLTAGYEGAGWGRGWYSKAFPARGLHNNTVLYPDEAFIIAKRTTGDATFELEGAVETTDRQMFLPESGNQMLMNNPYGTNLLLGELIPSTAIGTASDQFKPGSSATDPSMDVVTFLVGGTSTWLSYYYLSGVNDTVTAMREIAVRRSSSSMSPTDFYIGKGGVTNLESCTAADGSGLLTNGVSNDGNYTKITLSTTLSPSGRAQPETGFNITFTDIQGYLLSDGGLYEANATTGEAVTNSGVNQGGSLVFSDLIGTHEVVGSGAGYVVIQKQRDVNFKSDEGTPAWNSGSEGAGYSSAAKFYCVGGNNGNTDTNSTGTVSISGSTVTFNVSTAGSGYSSAPTAVTTGGGWRYQSDTNPQGHTVLSASGGLLIKRRHSSGVKTYIDTLNPF